MLHLLSTQPLVPTSAAVARARLHVALRTDRAHVAAAAVRTSRSETGDALLGRLLNEMVPAGREA